MAMTHKRLTCLKAIRKFMMKLLKDHATLWDTLLTLKRKERLKSLTLTKKRTLASILNSIQKYYSEVLLVMQKTKLSKPLLALTLTKLQCWFLLRTVTNSSLFAKSSKFSLNHKLLKWSRNLLRETNHQILMTYMKIQLARLSLLMLKKMENKSTSTKYIAWNLERRKDHMQII